MLIKENSHSNQFYWVKFFWCSWHKLLLHLKLLSEIFLKNVIFNFLNISSFSCKVIMTHIKDGFKFWFLFFNFHVLMATHNTILQILKSINRSFIISIENKKMWSNVLITNRFRLYLSLNVYSIIYSLICD